MPHPFADDKPSASLLKVRDAIGVSVAHIVGQPAPVAAKLGHAMSEALLKRDVAASEKTISLYSYVLNGRVSIAGGNRGVPPKVAAKSGAKAAKAKPKSATKGQSKSDPRPDPKKVKAAARPVAHLSSERASKDTEATLVVLWQLYGPDGKLVSDTNIEVPGKAADWIAGSDAAIARLASASADKLAPLMLDEAPNEAAVDPNSGRTRVMIGKVTGAPGNGSTALADAMGAVLKRREVAIVGDGDKPDLRLDCEVTADPPKGNKQHVKIVWHVRRPDGTDIGTVGQENDVPRGTLDASWGDLAYSVALAASDGLMQVIARGAPEPGQATATTTTAPQPAPAATAASHAAANTPPAKPGRPRQTISKPRPPSDPM